MNSTDRGPHRPCILIPVYNHSAVLRQTLAALHASQLPVVLVDDGSDAPCSTLLAMLRDEYDDVYLVRHDSNRGKGGAVKTGLATARALHFTHALQLDADGQHDRDDIPRFLEQSRTNPDAMICGYPHYDASVPKHRFYARYLTHVWVWINTLSTTIIDSMCGFRVYPLELSCQLLERCRMGNRMDFDGEFIVRWYWAGHALIQLQTRVTYPSDGVSHFRLWRDNLLISLMHAKLFLLLPFKLPTLLARRFRAAGQTRA